VIPSQPSVFCQQGQHSDGEGEEEGLSERLLNLRHVESPGLGQLLSGSCLTTLLLRALLSGPSVQLMERFAGKGCCSPRSGLIKQMLRTNKQASKSWGDCVRLS
jgi:hypothetical protein